MARDAVSDTIDWTQSQKTWINQMLIYDNTVYVKKINKNFMSGWNCHNP